MGESIKWIFPVFRFDNLEVVEGILHEYDGIWYASKAFVAYKTMNILVHKDALPKEIAKKLGIK